MNGWLSNVKMLELHDRFLSYPAIEPLLRGGELLEYGCHMVPEGGQAMLHDLTSAGLIVAGDAAGLALNTGSTVRRMDLAGGSGIAAGRVVDEALSKKGFLGQQGLILINWNH